MQIGLMLDYADDMKTTMQNVADLEAAGLDQVWVPEPYGFDAISQVGYIAARTSRLQIGTAIVNVFSRSPALMAMTGAGCDYVSGGRFMLGLGASGPQVIEGFHGTPFDRPRQRIAEYIAVCRMAWRREPVELHGTTVEIPVQRNGHPQRRPLKLISHPVRAEIPIWWASLKGRSVAQTAELADGWLPAMFLPERHRQVWGADIQAGLARRSTDLGPLEIGTGGLLAIDEHLVGDEADHVLLRARNSTALYVGGMGPPGANFYNDILTAYGYTEEARAIQSHFLAGRRDAAAASVPRDWVLRTNLVGPYSFVKERVEAYKEAGVSSLFVTPVDRDVKQIELLRTLVDEVG